jgi:serine/threonine-protein kinase
MSNCGKCGGTIGASGGFFGVLKCPACGMENFRPFETESIRFDKLLASSPVFNLYSGYDSASRFNVEIIVLRDDAPHYEWCRDTFKAEAENLMRLRHLNTRPLLGSGEVDGHLYVMEPLLDGATLAAFAPDRHPLISLDKIINILQPALLGLAVAHSKNLAHHDISPENIHIDARGIVRVKGFFISRFAYLFDQYMISRGRDLRFSTSPFLISPEKAESGTEDHRGDMFSLGVVFYYFLTGSYPFSGAKEEDTIYSRIKPVEKRRALLGGMGISDDELPDYLPPPPPNSLVPSIPADLSDLIMKALAYYPNIRVTIGEFIEKLNFMRAKADAVKIRKHNEEILNTETTEIPKMPALGHKLRK